MTLLPDWRAFIELLNSHGVEYVVVGAWARAFHGVPRSTDRVSGEMDGLPVAFLSLPLYKKNKLAAGRRKDLADLDAVPD